ncbi:MAG: hypothetical protein OD814_000008 [Candidatus Alkanophagales archaeon MCA70_species_1]|nr:hypothetical protein [Candidatus Alkanophaga volatiphilum]
MCLVYVLVGWSGFKPAFQPDEGRSSRPDRPMRRVGDPCEASSLFRREKLTLLLLTAGLILTKH